MNRRPAPQRKPGALAVGGMNMYETLTEALDAELSGYDVHSTWIDTAGRECGVIEVAGAHIRLARVEVDGTLTLRSEGEDVNDVEDPLR